MDSTDQIRMVVAQDELRQLLDHDEVKAAKVPILFFANKVGPRLRKLYMTSNHDAC